MTEWSVTAAEAGLRLDKYLASPDRLGSRARAATALTRGKVFLRGREAALTDAAAILAAGDVVGVWMDRPGSAKRRASLGDARDLPIVYEDPQLIVLDKPPGLLAVPLPGPQGPDARSVFDDVQAYVRVKDRRGTFVVHRIDRDTSGLVVFAKSPAAREHLRDQFRRRLPERVYLAVVHGCPSPPSGTWRDLIAWDQRQLVQKQAHPKEARGKEAICRYRVVEQLRGAALIEVTLVTGRRNQIRVQTRLHGHTIVGERKYVAKSDSAQAIPFPRQALHAHRLAFAHPQDGRLLRFEAPLPDDFRALLARLRAG